MESFWNISSSDTPHACLSVCLSCTPAALWDAVLDVVLDVVLDGLTGSRLVLCCADSGSECEADVEASTENCADVLTGKI